MKALRPEWDRGLYKSLFHFNLSDFFFSGDFLLREFHFQNTVVVGSIDIARLYIVHAEASGIRAVVTLPADVLTLVILILLFLVGSGDCEEIVLQVNVDIGFVEAGQFRLQQVAVALVDHVRLEGVEGCQFVVAPEVLEGVVKHLIEGIIKKHGFIGTIVE